MKRRTGTSSGHLNTAETASALEKERGKVSMSKVKAVKEVRLPDSGRKPVKITEFWAKTAAK